MNQRAKHNMHPKRFEEILSHCLEQMEIGAWGLEDCVTQYPELGPGFAETLEVVIALRQAGSIAPSPSFRRAAGQRLHLRLQSSARPPVRQPHLARHRFLPFRIPRFEMPRLAVPGAAYAALAIVIVALIGLPVTSALADTAVPGDSLYGLDRAFEKVQLGLATSPASRAGVAINLAQERLEEAQTLAERGDLAALSVLIDEYESIIQSVGQIVESAEDEQGQTLRLEVEEAIQAQQTQVERVSQYALHRSAAVVRACARQEVLPPARNVAARYGVSAEMVMAWVCEGYGYGAIERALSQNNGDAEAAYRMLSDKDSVRREPNLNSNSSVNSGRGQGAAEPPGQANDQTGPPDHSNAGGRYNQGEPGTQPPGQVDREDSEPPEHSNAGGNSDQQERIPPEHSNVGGKKDDLDS